ARLHARTFPACAMDSGAEALLILSDENALMSSPDHYPRDTEQAVTAARQRLESAGLDWRSAAIEARYARVAEIHRDVTTEIARATILRDRLMRKVDLHGKSFIQMLSSFACAIPGIMATRTIETRKDRLVTILVSPLMSCSARLAVYALLIAACIPGKRVLGFIKLQGLTMLSMYLLGTIVALLMAWLFKKTLLKGDTPLLIMELPAYKRPVLRVVLRHMWDRSKLFLRRAGTVILGINILLWFLATYPRSAEISSQFNAQRTTLMATADSPERADKLAELDKEESGEKLRYSFAGRM